MEILSVFQNFKIIVSLDHDFSLNCVWDALL
jgi:hypothetical protein